MKNFKNQKGITLVALVVTIIVLLILAGVSISLVAGNEGLLSRAKTAADTNQTATAQEEVAMTIADYQAEFYQAVYVDKTVSTNVDMGTWICYTKGYGAKIDGDKVVVGDSTISEKIIETPNEFEFKITAETAPSAGVTAKGTDSNTYTVTILENNRIPANITGTLSADGKIKWN